MGCLRTGCGHAVAVHIAGGGCLACSCTGFDEKGQKVPVGEAITRCSVCNRRPKHQGGGIYANHSDGCSRWGRGPDAREAR